PAPIYRSQHAAVETLRDRNTGGNSLRLSSQETALRRRYAAEEQNGAEAGEAYWELKTSVSDLLGASPKAQSATQRVVKRLGCKEETHSPVMLHLSTYTTLWLPALNTVPNPLISSGHPHPPSQLLFL
ncbi:hypothetical protein KUCAC02_015683, partial [Chaenocephalus aceratus]